MQTIIRTGMQYVLSFTKFVGMVTKHRTCAAGSEKERGQAPHLIKSEDFSLVDDVVKVYLYYIYIYLYS